jgi:hypothetical protein
MSMSTAPGGAGAEAAGVDVSLVAVLAEAEKAVSSPPPSMKSNAAQ